MKQNNKRVLLALNIGQHSYFKGAARYAAEEGWHLVTDMMFTGTIPHGWTGDGILTFLGFRGNLVDFITSRGIPVVDLSLVRDDVDLPRVAADNRMIGRLAAEHFLERGYRHYAWRPFRVDTPNRERWDGFVTHLKGEGLSCTSLPEASVEYVGSAPDSWKVQQDALIEQLVALPRPVGIFAYNDHVAAGVLAACLEAGLLVPEDAAILGVDNDPLVCESAAVNLSSVTHDLEGMAYRGAALLDRLMNGESPPEQLIRVPPKGVETRISTDMRAVPERSVARALRTIYENYPNANLSVPDVVASSGVSRRKLEIAFKQTLNHTINYEITNFRLKQVKKLLRDSSLTITAISEQTGFTRPNHLFRTFRKHLGVTPREFRLRKM